MIHQLQITIITPIRHKHKHNILSALVNLFSLSCSAIVSGNQMKCQKLSEVWRAYDAVKEHIINNATVGMQLNQPIFKILTLEAIL